MECACERGLADPEGESVSNIFELNKKTNPTERCLPCGLFMTNSQVDEDSGEVSDVVGRLGVKAHESKMRTGKRSFDN